MQRKNESFLRRFMPLLRFILSAYLPTYSSWINTSSDYFLKEVLRIVQTRGIEEAVSYVKTSRNAFLRTLSGQPLETCKGVELSSNGVPKWLLPISDLEDINKIRILLSYLTSLRAITLKPVLKTDTITDPFKGDVTCISYKEISSVAKALRLPKFLNPDFEEFHLTTKKGPLGQAILTSLCEVTLLPLRLITQMSILAGSKLSSIILDLQDKLDILGWTSVVDLWVSNFPLKDDVLRRISYFSDKEGKTRVIGIVDYWSQCALKPLHYTLNSILRRIESDMTFDQNKFVLSQSLSRKGVHKFHSIDLSAATDRMPILLQKRIIAYIIGEEKADAWHGLLTETSFKVRTGRKTFELLKYATGQPMGAYSSWPAMALTHHFIVRISAMRAGLPASFSDYFLLGDDLVIMHDSVAEKYKELLLLLDMPFSIEKTHVSKDTFEFAKRWFHKGVEITGFSVSGLMSVYKRYPLLHNFLKNQEQHGWYLPTEGHPDLIRGIHSILSRPRYIINRVENMIKLYLIFDSYICLKADITDRALNLFYERISSLACPEKWKMNFCSLKLSYKALLLNSKFLLIESDLYKFQTDAYKVDNTLKDICRKFIQGLRDPSVETQQFLMETLTVMLNWNHPIVHCLNRLIDKSTDYLCSTVLSDPNENFLPDFVIESGLQKYFVSHGVFSMRASHSICLAESAVIKKMISVLKEEYDLNHPHLISKQDHILKYSDPARDVMESGFTLIPRLVGRTTVLIAKSSIMRRIWSRIQARIFMRVIATGKLFSLFSIIIALSAYYFGEVSDILLFASGVYTFIKAYLSAAASGPTGTNIHEWFIGWFGIVFLHFVEFTFIVYLVCIVCQYPHVSEAIAQNLERLLDGVITVPEFFQSLGNYIIILVNNTVTQVVIPGFLEYVNTVPYLSPVSAFAVSGLISWSLIAFIRWLFNF